MAILKNIPVCKCDECDHLWLPDGADVPKRCPKRTCRKTSWNKSAGESPEKPSGKRRTVSAVERKVVRQPKNRLRSWTEPAIPKVDFRKRAAGDDSDSDSVLPGVGSEGDVSAVDRPGVLDALLDAFGYGDGPLRRVEWEKGVGDGQLPDGSRSGDDGNGYLDQGDDACPERSHGERSDDRLCGSLCGVVPAEAQTIVPRLIENPNAPGGGIDFNLIAEPVHRWPSEVDIVQELPIEEVIAMYPDRENEIREKVAEVVQEVGDGREVEDSGSGPSHSGGVVDTHSDVPADVHDGVYSRDGDDPAPGPEETRVVVVDEYSEGYVVPKPQQPIAQPQWTIPHDRPEDIREGETLAERFRRVTAALAEGTDRNDRPEV